MTKEEQISALRTNIEEQERNIRTLPDRVAALKSKEEAVIQLEKLRAGPKGWDGYLEQMKHDLPSDGLSRMLPQLQESLATCKARLAALEVGAAPAEALRSVFPPIEFMEEAEKLRVTLAHVEERLGKPPTGDQFDNIVRSQMETTRTFVSARLNWLIASYPLLGEEDAEIVAAPEPAGPTREQILAEPTVQRSVGAPDSPFPPSVEKGTETPWRYKGGRR